MRSAVFVAVAVLTACNYSGALEAPTHQKDQHHDQEQDLQGLAEAAPAEADTAASDAAEGREAPVHLAGTAELEVLVASAFPEDPKTALRIVSCESAWNSAARSATGDSGLFQINDIHRGPGGVAAGLSVEDLFDPLVNIRVARALYDESGWHPWVCY
jgi:soluble lytic murein transglycosylase-like protein